MKLFEDLVNGQFFEKTNPKSLSDRYYLKISPTYGFQVSLYPKRGIFLVGKDRVRIAKNEMVFPLTMLRGKAYRSNINGQVQLVAQGDYGV